MQGCKHFQPRLFYQVSLEQFVPKDHLMRRLDELLDCGSTVFSFRDFILVLKLARFWRSSWALCLRTSYNYPGDELLS
ncbi:MAG: hypothetical protein ACYTEL_13255 [Planctomycetota bacterium]|jgi:hypothetical protein